MTLAFTAGIARHASQGTRGGPVRHLFSAIQRSIAIARNRRALQGTPHYLLKDIGISRSDIDSIVVSMVDGIPDPTRRSRGRF
jgi:uncharacterized protein YjiS (DUF1127 family)